MAAVNPIEPGNADRWVPRKFSIWLEIYQGRRGAIRPDIDRRLNDPAAPAPHADEFTRRPDDPGTPTGVEPWVSIASGKLGRRGRDVTNKSETSRWNPAGGSQVLAWRESRSTYPIAQGPAPIWQTLPTRDPSPNAAPLDPTFSCPQRLCHTPTTLPRRAAAALRPGGSLPAKEPAMRRVERPESDLNCSQKIDRRPGPYNRWSPTTTDPREARRWQSSELKTRRLCTRSAISPADSPARTPPCTSG